MMGRTPTLFISWRSLSVISVFLGFSIWPMTAMMSCPPAGFALAASRSCSVTSWRRTQRGRMTQWWKAVCGVMRLPAAHGWKWSRMQYGLHHTGRAPAHLTAYLEVMRPHICDVHIGFAYSVAS